MIVVLTDDQAVPTFTPEVMPRTFRHFVDPGVDFTDFVVSTPLCCPARATLATGQYGHNNGVLRNSYGQLLRNRNVLPGWLRRAGYTTVHVGRFFNGYEDGGRIGQIAPGWDVWRTTLAPRGYYDYEMRTNKGVRSFGSADRDHLTATLSRVAATQIRRKARRDTPFYLQLDHLAPHIGPGARDGRCLNEPVPGPPDEDAYLNAPLPGGPGFNEADISDKPAFLQGLPILDQTATARVRRGYGCALAAVRTLDRGMGEIYRALRQSHALRNTAVIFSSDNGYLYGEHRIDSGKQAPYEEALRVPLAIRLPGKYPAPAVSQSTAPAVNIDLAPTILDLADAPPCKRTGCRVLDGRSLLGEALGTAPLDPGRAVAIELQSEGTPRQGLNCAYRGIRTAGDVYIEHTEARESTAEPCGPYSALEHYDRGADLFQLQNLAPAPGATPLADRQQQLADRLDILRDCAGVQGRDPVPASGHYCE